jgi:hypothetical protein
LLGDLTPTNPLKWPTFGQFWGLYVVPHDWPRVKVSVAAAVSVGPSAAASARVGVTLWFELP